MKVIKSLFAISMLAFISSANSAVIGTYSVTNNGSIGAPSGPLAGILSGTVVSESYGANAYVQGANNTATLDVTGSSGVLTININTRITTNLGGTQHMWDIVTVNGNWDGSTFTYTDGGYTIHSCVAEPGSNSCSPNTFSYTHLSGNLTAASGTLTTTTGMSSGANRFDNFVMSAVPVPAAAWLFGSGLIGLAGVAKRRMK